MAPQGFSGCRSTEIVVFQSFPKKFLASLSPNISLGHSHSHTHTHTHSYSYSYSYS